VRQLRVLCPLVALAVVAAIGTHRLAAQEATPVAEGSEPLILIERNERTQSLDLGDAGVSAGDLLVWGPNPFYDAENATATGGSVAGECVTLNADGKQHCVQTLVFPDGSTLTGQGIQQGDGSPATYAITGGTGVYLGAVGRLITEPSADFSRFTYTIELGA
jgi:hypothetical protein